jgi:hypothetical protein
MGLGGFAKGIAVGYLPLLESMSFSPQRGTEVREELLLDKAPEFRTDERSW